MCKNTFKTALIFLFFFSFLNYSVAQNLMYEISLSEQVAASSQIVEGKVISKKSYWDANHEKIFTVNTIEVYKVFKGKDQSFVEVITQGGAVGMKIHQVNPSLKLRVGDVGVFTLINHSISFESAKKGTYASFKAYSSKQGFYKYDVTDNVVANPFIKTEGITEVFYDELTKLTKKDFSEMKSFDVDKENGLLKKNASSKQLAATILSINPTTSSAGTKSVLTITGTGFGTSGVVEFKNADDGGSTWVAAYDSEIVSWSDTEIQVEINSGAGTGNIRVDPDIGPSEVSGDILTISYAELNVYSDAVNTGVDVAYQTHHTNTNISGGMTWQMFTDFDANTAAKESFIRALDTWRCETKINWIIGAVNGTDVIADEGINIIRFDNGNELDVGILGETTSRFSGCTFNGGTDAQWYVSELDMVFDEETNWEFGPANAAGGKIDFESVAVHELGHGHQLGHVIDLGDAIMHYSVSANTTNRILSANDIAGANDVHSRSTTIVPCGRFDGAMTDSNYVCPTASLDDQILAGGVLVYPNPTSDKLFITNHSNFNLQNAIVFDVSGRTLFHTDLSEYGDTKEINIKNLSQGVYFLKINSDKATTTKRFVVQ